MVWLSVGRLWYFLHQAQSFKKYWYNKLNGFQDKIKEYIEKNNKITEDYFSNVTNLQKKLFTEIKSKIKLDDTSLKFKDKKYYYWSKTEAKGNYGKNIRQVIDNSKPEEIFSKHG